MYSVYLSYPGKTNIFLQIRNFRMKKAFSIITTVLLVIVIVFAILLAGVRLVGITPYTVLSGSMEKAIHVGSLIYTVKPDPSELKVGDVITYTLENGTVVTHRIIELLPDEEDPSLVRFRTKGDNNETADGDPVHPKNVLGKMLFTIPLIGYVAWFVQNPPGSYIVIGVGIILVLLTFLPELMDKLDDKIKDKPEGSPSAESESSADASDQPQSPPTEESHSAEQQAESLKTEAAQPPPDSEAQPPPGNEAQPPLGNEAQPPPDR